MGVDVEIVPPSTPVENDTWKWARVKIGSRCDVSVFTTAMLSGAALRPWTQESVGSFQTGLDTIDYTWMKAKIPGSIGMLEGQDRHASRSGPPQAVCTLSSSQHGRADTHSVRERALNKAAAHSENTKTFL